MKNDRASFTAAWVAACRGLGALLPAEAQLADDPWGTRFGGLPPRMVESPITARALTSTPALLRWVLYMQVRTRVIDDALLAFARGGGRQVVLLGAGFDCRAARFAHELADATVYEVDHPATQAKKREVLGAAASPHGPRVVYLPWDFERQALADLGPALAAQGFDQSQRALTIWEGVTMYLTEPAIEATVAAVHAWSAPGSPLVFTYFEGRHVATPSLRQRVLSTFLARIGEPFRFGWDPDTIAAWFAARGFTLDEDRDAAVAAKTLLPPAWSRHVPPRGRHIAIATRRRASGTADQRQIPVPPAPKV